MGNKFIVSASKLFKRCFSFSLPFLVAPLVVGAINIHDPIGDIVYTIDNPPYNVVVLADSQFYSIFLILLIMLILQLVSFVVKYTSSFFPKRKRRTVI